MRKALDRLDLGKDTIKAIMAGVRSALNECRYIGPEIVHVEFDTPVEESTIRSVLLAMGMDGLLTIVRVPVHAGSCMANLVDFETAEKNRYELPDECEKCFDEIRGWVDVEMDLVFTE